MRFHLRSPTDDGVDRPDLEAPQGVKATGTNRPKQTHQTQKQTGFGETTQTTKISNRIVTVARVHYTVSDTTHTTRHKNASCVCRWPIAAGKRPDPFRTRKLSLLTLMVLQPGGCGRVRNRRHQTTTNNSIHEKRPFESTTAFKGSLHSFPPHNHTQQPRHTTTSRSGLPRLDT